MRPASLVRALTLTVAVAGALACGHEDASDPTLIAGFAAVNPHASNVTDTTVHLTCKFVGAHGNGGSPEVEYIYGVTGPDGAATEPTQSLTARGGFVDLTGLQPDTAYTVLFYAKQDGQRAVLAPTLTFRTQKTMDPREAFLLQVVPGAYAGTAGTHLWLNFVQVDDASCASGIGLIGELGGLEWRCMDFASMTAERTVGADHGKWTVGLCGCDALGADYGAELGAACLANGGAHVCENAAGETFELSLTGSETVGGATTQGPFFKRVRAR